MSIIIFDKYLNSTQINESIKCESVSFVGIMKFFIMNLSTLGSSLDKGINKLSEYTK